MPNNQQYYWAFEASQEESKCLFEDQGDETVNWQR